VGKDWESNPLKGNAKAAWNADGSVMEFSIEYPVDDLTGKTIGWNISASDSDNDGKGKAQLIPVKCRLFPIPGPVSNTEQTFIGELTFEK